MHKDYHVQQRDQREWRWVTVAISRSQAGATALAENVRRAVLESEYAAPTQVRVVSTSELAQEKDVGRAAAEMLQRANRSHE
jgi:hypothetical protein